MSRISRRQFLTGLACSGLCALGGGALLSTLLEEKTANAAGSSRFMREALYYTTSSEKLRCESCHGELPQSRMQYCHTPHTGSYAKCGLCPKGCLIADGHRGDCGVRENRGGVLYTMVYGNPCSLNIDPIEKKPFYHFLPASLALSLATAGCNLHCLYCQNWQISQRRPEEVQSFDLPPADVVAAAQQYNSPVIAYTYSEPTIFYEYMLDIARVARAQNVRSAVISAGYISEAPLRELCHTVDAIKIDFKGFSEDFYGRICDATLQPVLETMKLIQERGVHLEIVTLVVPTLNDDPGELRGLCRWIVQELGPDVPTHFSRFHPLYKLTALPSTPVETLELTRDIATEEGIRYAYVGNVPGHPGDNTYCHHCGEMIIRRLGFTILENHVLDGKCEYCGQPIPGVWK
jgi:pyruvate formate lyase activating enzyme